MEVDEIPSQAELESEEFYFGKTQVKFLPKQWEFTFCDEPDLAFRGGLGSAKTTAGIYRATRLSCFYPNNEGIIGRFAATDLAATTRTMCIDFWQEAGLLADFKEKKNGIPTAVLYCLDRDTNLKTRHTSKVYFLHVDNPGHLHGYTVGWFWIDEAQEARRAAWVKLVGRTRKAGFQDVFSHFVTANPLGHDWIWQHWVNPETLSKLKPSERSRRRYIVATTYENPFLPPDYIANMLANYSKADVKRYLEASDDVFEGQIYDEFSRDVHVIDGAEVFHGEPPKNWERYLAVDIGGSDPWAWIFSAIDPFGNIIIYDEIYAPGARVAPFARAALKRLKPDLVFRRKVIDWENKLAAGELAEHGIKFDNAKKQNKRDSIFRLNGYLHPSEERPHPTWHPRANQGGAPRLYIYSSCRNLLAELPQQRWKTVRDGDSMVSVADDSIPNHAVDALLYTVRELPKPTELPKDEFEVLRIQPQDLNSRIRWHERIQWKKQQKAILRNAAWCGGRGLGRRIGMVR